VYSYVHVENKNILDFTKSEFDFNIKQIVAIHKLYQLLIIEFYKACIFATDVHRWWRDFLSSLHCKQCT